MNSGQFKKGHITWNKGKHIQTNNALEIWRLNGGVPAKKDKKRPDRPKGFEPLPKDAIVAVSKELFNNNLITVDKSKLN